VRYHTLVADGFSLVYFSKSICIAQVIGMLHCAPEAALKPKCFEFTPKAVTTNVFVAQVYWEAVPKMVWVQFASRLADDICHCMNVIC